MNNYELRIIVVRGNTDSKQVCIDYVLLNSIENAFCPFDLFYERRGVFFKKE